MADNAFNVFEPQLVNPGSNDYHPVEGGALFSVSTFDVPDFPGGDRPSPPLSVAGNLSNHVFDDLAGAGRMQTGPPGAYSGSGVATTRFTISGRVVTAAGRPIPGVTIGLGGAATETASTDASGHYAFTDAAAGGSYTITPSLRKYSFAPQQQVFASLAGDQTANFIGKKRRHK
jgi:hypothetical protein